MNRGRRPDDLGGTHVEGRRAVRELLDAGRRRVIEVLIASDQDESRLLAEIIDLAGEKRVAVREVSRRQLLDEAATESPQGVIAKARPLRPFDLEELAAHELPFLILLDGITDPGNLGAVMRSAESAGATGVVLPRHRAARLGPAAVKAAAGAVEHIPIALVPGLAAAVARLIELEVWVVGLDGDAKKSLFELHLADEPIALALGAEGTGLSRLVRERCDDLVSIPQLGKLTSLNVAAAATLACYEVARRRALPE